MSMIAPESYVEQFKNASFEELIRERDSLIEEIRDLEGIVFDKEKKDETWQMCPGPDVRYQVLHEYLAQLCEYIKEKYNSEYVWGEDK